MKCSFKFACPITSALDVIGDRWVLIILKQMLFEGKQTFKDFKESKENIASNILTVRLNLLLENVFLNQNQTNNKSIYYHLTETGLSITSILVELGAWGQDNLSKHNQLMDKSKSIFRIKSTKSIR